MDQIDQAELTKKAAPDSTAPLAHKPNKKGKKKKNRGKVRKQEDSDAEKSERAAGGLANRKANEDENKEGIMDLGVGK